ncbi:hypothetical protein N658DRAFT_347769 [Parathielavia hyrcaniae]|uniref:Uncharacterized protein n=1 Tax=Parathielavia hyrcaniae TaxID=113614 RepID=A0AAN6PUZ0_9PEZI|nr:hypothetical protein N658DRAFT_347769 [Parathielavia hyrcaniae]
MPSTLRSKQAVVYGSACNKMEAQFKEKHELLTGKKTASSPRASTSPAADSGPLRQTKPSPQSALQAQPNTKPGVSQPIKKPKPSRSSPPKPAQENSRPPGSSTLVRGPVPSKWAARMSAQQKPRPTSSKSTQQPELHGRSS